MSGVFRSIGVLVGALAVAASWHDERWYAAAWLGMICFFAALSGQRARWGLVGGLSFGVCYVATAIKWAPRMLANTLACEEHDFKPWAVFGLLVLWEAIPFAVLGLAATWATRTETARRRPSPWPLWVVALGWAALETFWPRVFPSSLAHTQTGFLPVLQIAELGGASLVSFVLIAVSLDFGARAARRDFVQHVATAAPLLLLVTTLAFGWWRLAAFESRTIAKKSLRVGVVQVDPSYDDSTIKMRAASDRLLGVELLAWPESTLGTYSTAIKSLGDIRGDIKLVHTPFVNSECLEGMNAWLLAGGKSFEPGAGGEGPYFQTAYLVDPKGIFQGRYHKRELMPIGEYVPFEDFYPGLHDWAELSEYTSRGVSDRPVQIVDGAQVGVLLCYEDLVSELSRRTVASGAEILVCLINGSAFEEPVALEQHRRLATFRAIENRRNLIRCGGTGVSCEIAPTGAVRNRLPVNQDGSFVVDVPLETEMTLFGRGGYTFPYVAGLFAAVVSLVSRRGVRLSKAGAQ